MTSDNYIVERYTREQVVVEANSPKEAIKLASGPDHIRVNIIDPPQPKSHSYDKLVLIIFLITFFGIILFLNKVFNATTISGEHSERKVNISTPASGTENSDNK